MSSKSEAGKAVKPPIKVTIKATVKGMSKSLRGEVNKIRSIIAMRLFNNL